MFTLNEIVVYPGYGAAKISCIVEKKVGAACVSFFELRFINKDMMILIPVQSSGTVGIRKLSSNEIIDAIFSSLSKPVAKIERELTASNWNKRNKEYQYKLRTGDIKEICEVYRDLKYISVKKELSFGEKNLLQQTETLLVEEIALVTNVDEEKATENLRALFKHVQPAAAILHK